RSSCLSRMHPLLDLDGLDLEAKARRISEQFPALHDHPSGIFYSMMKIEGEVIRPFQPSDFDGVTTFDFKGWRIKPAGAWEYRNNEDSLTMADYWKQIDYRIFYLDHVWNNRKNLHAYNAIFVYLNTLAYDITGEAKD